MAAIYPTDYPFYYNSEGWPEPVYVPPYPFKYYYDNGRNAKPIHTTTEFRNVNYHQHSPNTYYRLPLAIRRHRPQTTDRLLRQLLSSPSPVTTPHIPVNRTSSQSITPRVPVNRTSSQSITPRVPVKRILSQSNNQRSISVDPDERPIRPMKDTSIYHRPPESKKFAQMKKPPPRFVEPIRTFRHESQFSQPLSSHLPKIRSPPSYISTKIPERRPVRTDLIPRTFIDDATPRRTQPSRRIVVEEYEDEDYLPVTYIKPLPRKVMPYKTLPYSTTHVYDDYEIPRVQRVVRVRSPPTEMIIYDT